MYLDRISSLDSGTVLIAANALARGQWEAVLVPPGPSAWARRPIFSWSQWLTDRWARAQADGLEGTDRLLLTRDQTDRLWQRVIEASEFGPTIIESRRLASWARAARRSLLDAGESLQRRGGLFADDAAASFLTWNREFDARLEANGWVDPDCLLHRINRIPSNGIAHDAVLLDPGWPWVEQTLLTNRWREAGFGFDVVVPDDCNATIRAVCLADPTDEAVSAANWAAEQLARNDGGRLAVVVPDLPVRRHEIEAIFGDRLGRDALSNSIGKSITDVAVFGGALRAIRLLSTNGDFADISRWLRSPFFHSLDPEHERLAPAVENRLRGDPRAQQSLTAAWRRHGLRSVLQRHLPTAARQLDNCLNRLPRRATPTTWSAIWQSCLKELNWQGTRVALPPDMHRAWDNAWARFAGLTPIIGRIDAPAAFETFDSIASTETINEPMRLAGVHLLSGIDQVGPGFAGAWIMDCTEQRLPGPSHPNPFVPWSLQLKHAMPGATPEAALARSREAIERLRQRVPTLVFSCPRRSEELTQTPSPLVQGWQAGPAIDTRKLFGPAKRIGARRWRQSESKAPPLAGSRIPGGTRTLDLQSSCPIRAFCIARLGAEPLRRPVRGFDPRLRGILIHRVLELVLGRSAGGSRAVTAEHVGQCLDRALEELAPPGDASWTQQKALERTRIEALISKFLELEGTRNPFTVVAAEERSTTTISGWQLGYRIDRIDAMTTGDRLLIDYKTGESPGGRWFDARLPECQLPLYALASDASGIATILLRGQRIEYRGAGTRACELPGQYMAFEDPEWTDQIATWATQIKSLIAEFAGGDVRIPTGAIDFVASDSRGHAGGAFAPVTRIGERQ